MNRCVNVNPTPETIAHWLGGGSNRLGDLYNPNKLSVPVAWHSFIQLELSRQPDLDGRGSFFRPFRTMITIQTIP